MMVAVLDALERLAGASDQDKPAWLAERRQGISATEIRDLYSGRITVDELVGRKLGRLPEIGDLSHIPAVDWGNQREPVIAEWVERRWGIRHESRVFHAADEPRFLASPDGVGVNFDEMLQVSEIKTTGVEIPPWSDAYQRKGYEFQQQWVMRVLGAERSLFVWEIREEDSDGAGGRVFVPGSRGAEWVPRNEKVIAELEEVARVFLAELDRAAAEPWDEPVVDEELDRFAGDYLRALELEREAKRLKEPAWQALLAAGRSQVSSVARVTYKAPVPVTVEEVDFEAAKADPVGAELFDAQARARELWDEFCERFKSKRVVVGRPTLRVTAIKQKGVS